MTFELVLAVVFLLLVFLFCLIWLFVDNMHISFVALALMLLMLISGFVLLGNEFATSSVPLIQLVFFMWPIFFGLIFVFSTFVYIYNLINPPLMAVTSGTSQERGRQQQDLKRESFRRGG